MTNLVERSISAGQAVLKGAMRPQTLPTQAREMASTMLAAAIYPLGWLDGGPGGRVRTPQGPRRMLGNPVLLVHGYLSNKSNWYRVERGLRTAGFSEIHALNYSSRRADLDALSKDCVERAREVMAATGSSRIHLIGHSLGGLVIRDAVSRGGLHEAASVATVATPHGGCDIARAGRMTARGNLIGQQLHPGSDYLRRLWAAAAPTDTRYLAYYSNLDLLVAGHRAKIIEPELAATNVLVKDHGHLSIILSRRLTDSLSSELVAVERELAHRAVRSSRAA